MAIEALRHLSVFSPVAFKNTVTIIGCGATGSKIALELAKLGVNKIVLYDFDTVEEHNIANQAFSARHIGMKKVDALKEILIEAAGADIQVEANDEKVDGTQVLTGVVFVLTDTMASRKEIWHKAIKGKININLMIETRMGIDSGTVYTVKPFEIQFFKNYEDTLYDDEAVVETTSACRASQSAGPTSSFMAGLSVWQMIKWFNAPKNDELNILENEIFFALRGSTTFLPVIWKKK